MTQGSVSVAPIPDEQLLSLFRAGDQAAFAEIYDRYAERIATYAARMLGHREEADEVCTEVFLRVVEGRWRPTGPLRGFLFTVAHRLCLDRIRSRTRRRRLLAWFAPRQAPIETAEEQMGSDERAHALTRALEGLSEAHRAVVLLTYAEGMSSAQVGEILGCTDQQVRSRLSYARRLLRDALEATDGG